MINDLDYGLAREIGAERRFVARVLFVVNSDRFFLTHRATWGLALQSAGATITVAAVDTGSAGQIRALGFQFVNIDLGRESIGIRQSARVALAIFRLVGQVSPDLVYLVATAAYTLGWPAALLRPRARIIRVATGAGRALHPGEVKGRAASVVRLMLRLSSKLSNVWTLFQLESDRESFCNARLAQKSRSRVIAGTGIDTRAWAPNGVKETPPLYVFAARLFREKGVYEFVEISRLLRGRTSARFVLVGAPDPGVASSITNDELAAWVADGVIEYWGYRADMNAVFAQSTLLVFPSTHPEGTPKTLIEAASCEVVCIASDQSGCRAVVEDNLTGLILPAGNPRLWAEELLRLESDPDRVLMMAVAARRKMVDQFDIEVVLNSVLDFAGAPKGVTA